MLEVSDRVAIGIKLALDRAGIDMPFPHTVVLFHDATGSPGGDIERDKYLDAQNDADLSNALPSRSAKRVLVQNRESLPSFRRKSSQPLNKLQSSKM